MTRFPAAALALASLLIIACSSSASGSQPPAPTQSAPQSSTPVPTVIFGSTRLRIDAPDATKTIDVLVATTGTQSQRGLGYRDALAADSGMMFDLHTEQVPVFWMKGMRFPLDMVWIGEDKRVAGVTADVPAQPGAADHDLKLYGSPAPVRFVLELNAGAAARLGIEAGTLLEFDLPSP